MLTHKVRKNFLIDKELAQKVQRILHTKQKNMTEAIGLYFQALVKNPDLLDEIEQNAQRRSGSFIGMLDGEIGNDDFKTLKKKAYGTQP